MKYEYWFANIKGMTSRRKWEIRNAFTTLEELYNIEETEAKRHRIEGAEYQLLLESIRSWDLEAEHQKLSRKRVRCITMANEAYPKRLRQIADAPYALYVKGELPSEEQKTVAIIGARECSPYGACMAQEFAKALADSGVQIISGMARGVDSAGQQGALAAGGKSFGVLGCGVDICYPRDKIGLYVELQEQGGVLSEFPLGAPPLRQHFPARNRIISALSDVVLVMEAKEKSGSLITVDMALEQGKEVYALPGPVNSLLSQGCNELIRQGAGILVSPQKLLEEIGIWDANSLQNQQQKKLLLETTENIVYSCLDFHPQNLEALISRTRLPVADLLDALISLELQGFTKEISKNYYVKVK